MGRYSVDPAFTGCSGLRAAGSRCSILAKRSSAMPQIFRVLGLGLRAGFGI